MNVIKWAAGLVNGSLIRYKGNYGSAKGLT